jgi:CheY-like chemotaxis protein
MPKVLFVDDEDDIRTIAQIALEPEFTVTPAASGAEALACVARERPDVVVLDVMMPEVDGYETLRRMRELPNGTAPVVLLTAKLVDFTDELRAQGVVAVMKKPFDPLGLPSRLRGWLRTG